MTTRYAEKTTVSSDRTRAEIERVLMRYGAAQFMYGFHAGEQAGVVEFVMANRRIRFIVRMPDPNDREFTRTAQGRSREPSVARGLWEQACRSRWRALLLIIKAKLEAVQSGIVTLEDEFLPFTVLPNGRTYAEWAGPQVEHVYRTGQMPPMLPGTEALKALGDGK